MNIDQHNLAAAASAALCRRYGLVRAVALACALAAPMALAHAGHGERERIDKEQRAAERAEKEQIKAERVAARQAQQAAAQPRQGEMLRNDTRQFDPRSFDTRQEEQRRALQMQQDQGNGEGYRRAGRLTADERRDLRRQINEAGIDIYRNAPRR